MPTKQKTKSTPFIPFDTIAPSGSLQLVQKPSLKEASTCKDQVMNDWSVAPTWSSQSTDFPWQSLSMRHMQDLPFVSNNDYQVAERPKPKPKHPSWVNAPSNGKAATKSKTKEVAHIKKKKTSENKKLSPYVQMIHDVEKARAGTRQYQNMLDDTFLTAFMTLAMESKRLESEFYRQDMTGYERSQALYWRFQHMRQECLALHELLNGFSEQSQVKMREKLFDRYGREVKDDDGDGSDS